MPANPESKHLRRLIQLEIERYEGKAIPINELTSRVMEEVALTEDLVKGCLFFYIRTKVNLVLRGRRTGEKRVTVKVAPGSKLSEWENVRVNEARPEQLAQKVKKYKGVIEGAKREVDRLDPGIVGGGE